MPSSIDSASAGGKWRRRSAAAVAVAAVALVSVYASLPWLAAVLAPRLAGMLGLDDLRVAVERPGWQALEIRSLELIAGRLHLVAGPGVARYRLTDLLRGRLASLRFQRVLVRVEQADDAPPSETPPSGLGAPDAGAPFLALPAEHVAVEVLEVEVPEQRFRARGDLRASGGELQLNLGGLAPPAAERFDLQAHVRRSGLVTLRVGERGSERQPFLALITEVAAGALELHGELALEDYAFELAAALAGLPPGDGALQGELSATVVRPLPTSLDAGVSARARLNGRWRPRDLGWTLTMTTAEGYLEQGVVRLASSGTLVQADRRFDWQGHAEALALDGAGGEGELRLTRPGQDAPLLALAWVLAPRQLAVDGTFAIDGAPGRWLAPEIPSSAGRGNLAGTLAARMARPLAESWERFELGAEGTVRGAWTLDDPALDIHEVEGNWRLAAARLSGSLQGVLAHAGMALPATVALDGAGLEGEVAEVEGTATFGGVLEVPFSLDYDLEAGTGTLSARTDAALDRPLAAAVVRGWDQPFDVTGGRLTVAGELRWPGPGRLQGAVRLDLDRLAAHYRDYRIAGVTSALQLAKVEDSSWQLSPAGIRIDRLDTGVELRDIATGVAWSGDTVTVEATRGRALGGSIGTGAFAYRITDGAADVVVDVTGVELARVLALEGGHVSGTGTLNGSLPVEVRDNVPSVVAGRVRAEPPGGVIRVSPTLAGASGQPGLDFALRALEDFRYTALEADVAYSGAGDLTLAVRLEGRNPAIEEGRPIHYNVTVTENVPTLLRSLRLQDEVTREIERQVAE